MIDFSVLLSNFRCSSFTYCFARGPAVHLKTNKILIDSHGSKDFFFKRPAIYFICISSQIYYKTAFIISWLRINLAALLSPSPDGLFLSFRNFHDFLAWTPPQNDSFDQTCCMSYQAQYISLLRFRAFDHNIYILRTVQYCVMVCGYSVCLSRYIPPRWPKVRVLMFPL